MLNRRLRFTFDKVSKTYNSRKKYPKKIIRAIIKFSRISKDSIVLDIGCGNGRSTIPFAGTGAKILGIDISRNMINEAQKSSLAYPNLSYKKIAFEKAALPLKSFDLIMSGTAFHWLQREAAYRKISKLLKERGNLVIFWSSGPRKVQGFGRALQKIYSKNTPRWSDVSRMEDTLLSEIRKSGYFKEIKFKKYRVIERFTKKQFFDDVGTRSFVISLNAKRKFELFRNLNALCSKYRFPIARPREYKLITARKKTS